MTTFAKQLAEEHPDEIAIRDDVTALDWGAVDDVLNRVANGLMNLDLGPDQRIAVFAENAVETAMANLGGLVGGASVVPVNFHLTAEEVAYILEDSGARVLFVGPETAERGVEAAKASAVHTVISWADTEGWGEAPADAGGVKLWSAWLAEQSGDDPPDDVRPRPNLLYTSGTTGHPKGTELPPTMFAGGDTVAEHLANLAQSPMAGHGKHMIVGPMYHTGPLSGARLLAAGRSSVILGRFDAENTLRTIDEHGIGNSVMVPTHFVRLLALPDEIKAKYDMSSLQAISHTGAKCPVEVKRAMIEWWGPVFLDAYGATEVGTTCAINSEEWLKHPGSVGKAIPPFEAMVLDDDDNSLPPNQEGRLYFKDATGRGVVYHNDPAKSAAAHIAPGVFTLGEIAYMDEDGYVFITDRFSDMVVSGGTNIYPAEAEQVLIEHPSVLDIACIGVPHAEMGEELKALAIPSDDAGGHGQAVYDMRGEKPPMDRVIDRRIELARLHHMKRQACRRARIGAVLRALDGYRAEPQGQPGGARLPRSAPLLRRLPAHLDRNTPGFRPIIGHREQTPAAHQHPVARHPRKQVATPVGNPVPLLEDVTLAVGDDRDTLRLRQRLLGLFGADKPAVRLLLLDRQCAVIRCPRRLRARPKLCPGQPQQRPAVRRNRDHRMHEQAPVGAVPDRPQAAHFSGMALEVHFRGVLDRQHVQSPGAFADLPAGGGLDLRCRHPFIAKKAAKAKLLRAPPAKSAQRAAGPLHHAVEKQGCPVCQPFVAKAAVPCDHRRCHLCGLSKKTSTAREGITIESLCTTTFCVRSTNSLQYVCKPWPRNGNGTLPQSPKPVPHIREIRCVNALAQGGGNENLT